MTEGSAVLVHGGWGNPDDWTWVQRPLEARGVQVSRPDLPSHHGAGSALPEDARSVREAIRRSRPPVVVVGWSYGGEVVSAAADAEREVAGLVYVSRVPRNDGYVPDVRWLDGDRILHGEDGTCVIDDHWWREEEAGATFPAEVRQALRSHPRRPITTRAFADPLVGEAWRTTRAIVLMGHDDVFLDADDERWMAAQPELDVRMLDCDHFVLFRDPGVIVDAVLELLTPGPSRQSAGWEPS